jgi:PAS domain S-box-containing protein
MASKNIEKSYRSLFRAYDKSDYSIQQKARFVFYFSMAMIGFLILLLLLTLNHTLINTQDGTAYFPDLFAMVAILITVIVCQFLLIKGHYSFAVHLLLISTMVLIWLAMLLERGETLANLDSIVFILSILTTLPLLIKRYKRTIVIYILLNLGVLFIFINIMQGRLSLSDSAKIEYLIDTSIAFIFIGVVGFFIFRINKQSFEKAVSDLKRRSIAEEALSESERKFKDLSDLLPQTVFETDKNGKITYFNKNGISLFGYCEEDLRANLNIFSLLSEPDRVKAIGNFTRLLNEELNPDNLYTGLRKDGSTIPLQIFARPIMVNGISAGIRGIVVDITDRIEAEKSLRDSEQKYRVLFENAQLGIYQTTPEGRILNVNPALLEMIGYGSIEELKEINLENENLHSGRPLFKKMIENEGFVRNFETQWITHGGKLLDIIENSIAVKDINGNTLYYDGFVENITERKKSENELRQSEERYRTILAAFPEMIIMADLDGKIIYGNSPFEKITGLVINENQDVNLFRHVYEEDRNIVKDSINEMFLSGKPHTNIVESRFVDKWGKIHWFSGVFSKAILSNNVVVQFIARDITEKKMIESELEKHRNNLEFLVIERTEELETINEELRATNEELYYQKLELGEALSNLKEAQNKLIQSEKMASVGVLAAGIAHEINNPLNFIQGGILGIESYFRDNLEEHMVNVLPLIDAVSTGVKRSANIVSSLNHYSRTDDLHRSVCDLNFIIDNCLTILNNQLKNKVEIVKFYTSDSYELIGNEGKLHQAFLNIISNAAQSIEKQGIITITTSLKEGFITIRIDDTGCGINAKVINNIFDPFFTTKGPGKGTGLGLSITYNIIQEHYGNIEFESSIGEGTKVTVKLPIEPK